MKLINFPEQNTIYAKDQPQYLPLPAHKFKNDPSGEIVCCWKLTLKERIKVLFSGKIWHSILTFNNSLQPQKLTIEKPKMNKE